MSEDPRDSGGQAAVADGDADESGAGSATYGLLPAGEPRSDSVVEAEEGRKAKRDARGDEDDDDDDDEEDIPEQHTYKFDPVTEYVIKVGRQNGRLDAAWDFYAHYVLPTYVRREGSDDPTDFRLQEPGEMGGRLYHLWKTPLKQLGDFGVGMGLYFQTLYVMTIVFFLAGVLNSVSIAYFRSDTYSGGQGKVEEQIAKGSAACTLREVVCLSPDCTDWTPDHRPCTLEIEVGLLDFCTTVALFIVVVVLGKIQNNWARSVDEDVATAADYSVVVQDPDPSDIRPANWRDFFERRFGRVRYVTVAVKNGDLMRLLKRRFDILDKIRWEAKGQDEEDLARDPTAVMVRTPDQWHASRWKLFLMKTGFAQDIVTLHEELVKVSAEIAVLARSPKGATKIFVTFEKESSQRECLKTMTTGLLCSIANKGFNDGREDLVLDGNVLSVYEAPEPGDVIWENLEVPLLRRMWELFVRLVATGGIVYLAGIVVYWLSQVHPTAAAAFIAVNNAVLPALIMWLMHNPRGGEHHQTNSSYQASLMLKIVLAQWMNTAFIIYVIQNIDEAPTEAYIRQISSILWADAFTQPLVKVLDLKSRFEQYVMAPFEKTQGKMNSYFLGTPVILAERYASVLKTMFVCLFFSSIFPQGYYVAAMALFMNYWTSKYCLFNRWKTPAPCNDALTIIFRRYLLLALVTHILVSLQFYSGWPFDGYCVTDQTVTTAFSDMANINVTETDSYVLLDRYPQVGDPVYEQCDQDTPAVWNELPKDWMGQDQKTIVLMFSVFGIVMTVVVGFLLFGETIYLAVRRLCHSVYTPVGKATPISYSEVEQIQAYVPEVRAPNLAHSLIATDIKYLDKTNISWTGDYQAYNLCAPDAFPGKKRRERTRLFSRIVHYRSPLDTSRNPPAATSTASSGCIPS